MQLTCSHAQLDSGVQTAAAHHIFYKYNIVILAIVNFVFFKQILNFFGCHLMSFDVNQSQSAISPDHQNVESEIVEEKPNDQIIFDPKTLEEAFKAILQSYPDKQYTTIEVTRSS